MRPNLRREALERLATLSASNPNTSQNDIARLAKRCPGPRSSSTKSQSPIPITLPELEALLALCKAAPRASTIESAAQFLPQISSYLPRCHAQALDVPLSLPDSNSSPWESLAYNLTSAVLSLGLSHPSLRQHASSTTARYVSSWLEVSRSFLNIQLDTYDEEDEVITHAIGRVVTLAMSLLGFLEAAAINSQFWTPHERLHVVRILRDALSEKYMITLETALSVIRNARHSDGDFGKWKHYSRRYASSGRPLGAMLLRLGFIKLVTSFASLEVISSESLGHQDVLELLLSENYTPASQHSSSELLIEQLAEISADELKLLEDGSDYLQLGSAWQLRLASAVKANSFTCLLCCALLDEEIAEPDALLLRLENTMSDPIQVLDDYLASVVFKSVAILSKASPTIGSNVTKSLSKIIVQGRLDSKTSYVVAECLASVLKKLPQDATITTLYSLGNVLSTSNRPTDRNTSTSPSFDVTAKHHKNPLFAEQNGDSVLSLGHSMVDEPSSVYLTTIEAIVRIASTCGEDKIIALALSMLMQKIGRLSLEVDAKIVTETAILGVHSAVSDLKSLLKLYSKLSYDALVHDNTTLLDAVMRARMILSEGIKRGSDLFEVYLLHLLDAIVSKGDAHENDSKPFGDIELAAREIAQLLRPLATFAALTASPNVEEDLGIEGFANLQRDAWFNAVVHGFSLTSPYGVQYRQELQTLAKYTMPLIAEDRAYQLESDIELNTTLRRGKSPEQASEYRKHLVQALPKCESEIKSLNYSELVFLTSAYLVENLRAMSGDCTRVLTYFLDPRLRSGDLGTCMVQVSESTIRTYVSRTKSGKGHEFSSPHVAQQLALFFSACCHRISKVQNVAIGCADWIISQVPSALCHKSSLYALFELLSIMWISCLEQDTEEYEWRSKFTSEKGKVEVELSDDYSFRWETLVNLHKWAKSWVKRVLDISPLDIKGLIQTYLSDYSDEGSYDHISLGRSFALEMGGLIPSTDQRLGAVPHHPDMPINTASDFIVQYTTRQEYRYIDGLQDINSTMIKGVSLTDQDTTKIEKSLNDTRTILEDIENRASQQQTVSVAEIRDVLRRAGALLCRTHSDEGAIIHHLVGIPFAVLSKQAIKLGISLWTGVIKENPCTESRILAEVAECWENTVRKRRGLFDRRLGQLDPFFVKQEFAPSDRGLIMRRQHFAYELIAPHLRLLQFLSSHFNASRLGTPHIQRIYQRLIGMTLETLSEGVGHPLAREAFFHVILLALRILRFSTNMDVQVLWRFKDRLLSAALAWFLKDPKWSYGGNRLQVQAETHLLEDLIRALEMIRNVGMDTIGSMKSLYPKHELLGMLLSNEHTRLHVWLYPLEPDKRLSFTSHHHSPTEAKLSSALKTAWVEDPSIAVQFVRRFHSLSLQSSLRFLLLNFPEKVLNNREALEIILSTSLAEDVKLQLKYLLYWVCVNPITAVSYFLPAYGNDPFVIQYAMRALESHSVDTTFFYVPQIVQTLRYDSLGYVQRYIIETGKFSQLFAHQIIWNMKANAYKDEGSEIPDPVKPVLDIVMTRLIESFSPEDKDFYEKEFSFFDEVTGISGKLKPLIKKSKPEKKQKIEEELRKIKVEPGVYLPCNPEGVVIGIDRKSGKPLQSHAKAPYMATFRIRKESIETTENEEQLIKSNGKSVPNPPTYEVWQSAIFKVGDDCRQDILALQLIAAFRGIFHSVGLDVYVNPYRVTATAPGCGVVDVLPNSISRDMLGREAVNGLYDYFISKYGGEDSIRLQEARNNFVKSMAAYSVISFLLQFKDRHNGNIMIDDTGHILHIDFGFCFDIVPGGVKFERAPFKLTAEMVAVMGGSTSQSYRWFEELCVKAFLACRQHSEHLVHMVAVMLDSGLPCFKPTTVKHLRERFVLEKSEKDAAEFMMELVRKSHNSIATKGYDHFQLLTNGIPY